jgi:hypothetical protein
VHAHVHTGQMGQLWVGVWELHLVGGWGCEKSITCVIAAAAAALQAPQHIPANAKFLQQQPYDTPAQHV